jgi:hypothetical protein
VSELIALNKARVIKKRSQREHNAHAYHYTPNAVTIRAYSFVLGPAGGGRKRTFEPKSERKLRTNRRFTFRINRL